LIFFFKKSNKNSKTIYFPGKRKPRFSRVRNAFDGLNAGKHVFRIIFCIVSFLSISTNLNLMCVYNVFFLCLNHVLLAWKTSFFFSGFHIIFEKAFLGFLYSTLFEGPYLNQYRSKKNEITSCLLISIRRIWILTKKHENLK